jgi:hypothetical protein
MRRKPQMLIAELPSLSYRGKPYPFKCARLLHPGWARNKQSALADGVPWADRARAGETDCPFRRHSASPGPPK